MKKHWENSEIEKLYELASKENMTWKKIAEYFDVSIDSVRKTFKRYLEKVKDESKGPKILVLDIETAPMLTYLWRLYDQVNDIKQIEEDWFVLSWSARWLGQGEVMYADQRYQKDLENDRDLMIKIRDLLDEADIVLTHNGVSFDSKKLNTRFLFHKIKPPSSYKQIDTYLIAKKHFCLTSNKLEYLAELLGVEHKKLKHQKFAGLELWRQCLYKNMEAFEEMERYNINDVLALEDVYNRLAAWDNSIHFDVYNDEIVRRCNCGCSELEPKGYHYTKKGKYQKYICKDCGKEHRDSENLHSKEKRKSLLV
jgi:DNA polymerase elongation subunit (family B)